MINCAFASLSTSEYELGDPNGGVFIGVKKVSEAEGVKKGVGTPQGIVVSHWQLTFHHTHSQSA